MLIEELVLGLDSVRPTLSRTRNPNGGTEHTITVSNIGMSLVVTKSLEGKIHTVRTCTLCSKVLVVNLRVSTTTSFQSYLLEV